MTRSLDLMAHFQIVLSTVLWLAGAPALCCWQVIAAAMLLRLGVALLGLCGHQVGLKLIPASQQR